MLLLNAIDEAARRSAERPGQVWAVWTSREDDPSSPFRYRASWASAASLIGANDPVLIEFHRGRVIRPRRRSY